MLCNKAATALTIELMKNSPALLVALAALVLIPAPGIHAQQRPGGEPGPGQNVMPDRGQVHRSLSALEGELVALIDQKEQLINASEARNEELRKAHAERNRAQGKERERLDARIDQLNNQARAEGVQLSRIGINSERIRLEIDRLMRFDSHLATAGNPAAHGGRTPAIRAINVVRTKREGPKRVTGQGMGFEDITVYEVIFTDGSRQNVESRSFVPQRP
jgi:hypothetical protein